MVKTCREILSKDPTTKIICFADGAIGGGIAAKDVLTKEADLGCTWLEQDDSVMEKNRKISWYQYADITEEDKKRPRILVLHFEHAGMWYQFLFDHRNARERVCYMCMLQLSLLYFGNNFSTYTSDLLFLLQLV